MNLKKFTNLYLRERAVTEASCTHYRFVARVFCRDTHIYDINDITLDVLIEWRDVILDRGASRSTWNNYLSHMRALLNYASRRKFIQKFPNPSHLMMPVHMNRPKTLRPQELEFVMTYLANATSAFQPNWFWAVVLRTLFYTGMRRRQLCQLKWRDVDLEQKTINLRAESSKNRRNWEIPIAELLIPHLVKLKQLTVNEVPNEADINHLFVFDIKLFCDDYPSCTDGFLTVRALSNFFYRLRAGTGVDISPHKLRHTMATSLARLGLYKELQVLLGHTNIQTTMRYVHPDLESLRMMTDRLSSIG